MRGAAPRTRAVTPAHGDTGTRGRRHHDERDALRPGRGRGRTALRQRRRHVHRSARVPLRRARPAPLARLPPRVRPGQLPRRVRRFAGARHQRPQRGADRRAVAAHRGRGRGERAGPEADGGQADRGPAGAAAAAARLPAHPRAARREGLQPPYPRDPARLAGGPPGPGARRGEVPRRAEDRGAPSPSAADDGHGRGPGSRRTGRLPLRAGRTPAVRAPAPRRVPPRALRAGRALRAAVHGRRGLRGQARCAALGVRGADRAPDDAAGEAAHAARVGRRREGRRRADGPVRHAADQARALRPVAAGGGAGTAPRGADRRAARRRAPGGGRRGRTPERGGA